MQNLADKYNKSAAQLALKWLIDKNIVAIPKASSKAHLKANLNLFDWELPAEAREKIDKLNQNNRLIEPSFAEFDY